MTGVPSGTYHWSKDMDGKSSINAVNTPEEDSPLRETHSDPFKKPRYKEVLLLVVMLLWTNASTVEYGLSLWAA